MLPCDFEVLMNNLTARSYIYTHRLADHPIHRNRNKQPSNPQFPSAQLQKLRSSNPQKNRSKQLTNPQFPIHQIIFRSSNGDCSRRRGGGRGWQRRLLVRERCHRCRATQEQQEARHSHQERFVQGVRHPGRGRVERDVDRRRHGRHRDLRQPMLRGWLPHAADGSSE